MVWTSDPSIVNGLSDVGDESTPTVFLDGSTLKLISGEHNGHPTASFNGWYWNGSLWVSDASIVNGLGYIGFDSFPTVFLDGDTLKLISGGSQGGFFGWYWDGSLWVSDASIVNGLDDIGLDSSPTVFLDGSTLKLISGDYNGTFNGWYWSGSSWVSDSSIISGLGDIGSYSTSTIFIDGTIRKLISGEYNGVFYGWYWDGSSWVSDSSIVDGLNDVGWLSVPTVFLDGSTLKLISGSYNGFFYGYTSSLPPVADAGGPYMGNVGSGVVFDGSGSTDADGTIVLYEWDFGDSETGVGVNANHIYTVADTYTVVLTVTDDDGLTDSDTTVATISEAVAVDDSIPDIFTLGRFGKKRRHRVEV